MHEGLLLTVTLEGPIYPRPRTSNWKSGTMRGGGGGGGGVGCTHVQPVSLKLLMIDWQL